MTEPSTRLSPAATWARLALVVLLLFIFLVGIKGLGGGFKALGKDVLDSFFMATENPFMGLVIGILGTTLMQSSSVSTSMIVALVAAPENPLPVAHAIPMIMGANIGTTVTATLVALGHLGNPDEFKRAFAAATCHDFFNFMAVALLLPLEVATGFLQKASGWLAHALMSWGTVGAKPLPNPLKVALKAVIHPIESLLQQVSDNPRVVAVLMIVVSAAIILVSLLFIVRTSRVLAEQRMESMVGRLLDANPSLGIVLGLVMTAMVQSSSITTSVLVPLAGAGLLRTAQVFPIMLGANLGTTVTALIASMAAPPETAEVAVQVALTHLLFNFMGMLLVYPAKVTRQIPIRLADWLARVAVRSRRYALVWVVALFYGVPALLVAVSHWL